MGTLAEKDEELSGINFAQKNVQHTQYLTLRYILVY